MIQNEMSFFGLQGSVALAEDVARRLDIALAPHEERVFEDGEHKARPLQTVRGRDVYVLHSLYGDDVESGNDKLCRLLFFCGALKDAGADSVTAVVPYLCYARKDRRTKTGDPITTRYVAAMFEAVGINRVITLEVHNVIAFENAFRCPTIHIEAAPLFAAHLAPALHGHRVVAVSPDAGGAKRVEQFRRALEERTRSDVGSAYMEKHRISGVVTGSLLAGDVAGKVAVIVDDMISTGGTLVRAAEACRQAGATKVLTAAAHGLFINGAPDLLGSSAVDGIVVTNTVPPFRVPPDRVPRLTVIDAGEAIASAMLACRNGS